MSKAFRFGIGAALAGGALYAAYSIGWYAGALACGEVFLGM